MRKNILKIGLALLGVFLFMFGTTWLFNHVDPWIAIAVKWIGIIIIAAIVIPPFWEWLKEKEPPY